MAEKPSFHPKDEGFDLEIKTPKKMKEAKRAAGVVGEKEQEKRLTEEQKEFKEKKGRPFSFVYRENDLFRKYIPIIEAFLKEQGHQVRIQGFPAGTPEKKIRDWYSAHKKELGGLSVVLADNTVVRSSDFGDDVTYFNLDSLMRDATREAIMGEGFGRNFNENDIYKKPKKKEEYPKNKEKYLSILGEMYKKMLNSIPKEKRQKLEVVILKGGTDPRLITHEPYCRQYEDISEKLNKETDEFADRMKQWFNDAGISNITIYKTGAEIPYKTVEKLKKGQAYIIYDRHTPSDGYGEENSRFWGSDYSHYAPEIEKRSALRTPIETFYSDIEEKLGIEVDPQKMEKLVKKILQKKLAQL